MNDTQGDPGDSLILERDGGVVTIINNNAPMNSFTFEYFDALEHALAELRDDPTLRAIVFTSAGNRNFSVGMDLKQLASGTGRGGGFDAVLDQRARVLATIENMHVPTIATMFGYCLGGGLELPLACHFRLCASEGARIGLPELELGTVPAWGGTARLTRTVGRSHALDMILRARKIDGKRALEIGLVHELHPADQLVAAARELAGELAAMPPVSVRGVLDCVVGHGDAPLDDALDAERRAVAACATTKDQREGMMAFLEKRRPVFTGE